MLCFRARGSLVSTANRELVHRWFEEVWNKQREEAIDEMFARDGKSFGIPEPDSVLVGPEAFKAIHRHFLSAFPNLHFTIHDVICEGDRVAATWTVEMTHLGDSLGFAATMQEVSLDGCSVLTVRDGKLQDGRNYMDLEALMNRLKASSVHSSQFTVRSS